MDRIQETQSLGERVGLAVAEASSVLLWISNTDKQCIFFNNAWLNFRGRTLEQEYGFGWAEGVHPEDYNRCIKIYSEAFEAREHFSMNYRLRKFDGSYGWIQDDGAPYFDKDGLFLGYIGSCFDITHSQQLMGELEQQKEQLLKLEQRNRALLDYSPVCHKILDLNFNLQFMNRNGFKMLALPVNDDCYGKPYPFSFFSDRAKSLMLEKLSEVVKSKKRCAFESPASDKNGNNVWLFHNIIPVFKSDDVELDYLTVVSADITEQKKVQQELNQKDKMEAIGHLAGGIAHDFNNQLSTILGYAQLLQRQENSNTSQEYLSRIVATSERSAKLIQQLLTFSRKQQLETQLVDLNNEIVEVVELLQHTIDKRVVIIKDLTDENAMIMGDRSLLQSAFINLVLNASDAMNNNGTLKISSRRTTVKCSPQLSLHHLYAEASYICISFEDNGCGMDEDTQAKIFEPFFTTKELGKGTGMGLASVYGVIKQHQGYIFVNSELGSGTCFSVFIPAESHSLKQQLTSGTTQRNTSIHPRYTALIVDDEEMIRDMCRDYLSLNNFDVFTAQDGEKAIQLYREHWESIDVVVLDMIMPVLSGRDTLNAMREINPNIKAVFSSGYVQQIDESDSQHGDDIEVIDKPYKLELLLDKLRNLAAIDL